VYVTYSAMYDAQNEFQGSYYMQPEEVKKLIEAGIPGAEVTVSADGGKYVAVVVSSMFEGKTMIAEQKMVYATVNEHIQSGAIHALTIKAYTPEEFSKLNS